MEAFTLEELVQAVGGTLLGEYRDRGRKITGVLSDHREVTGGEVFFAFVGKKNNAHRFVGGALAAGAAGCVISEDPGAYVPGKFYVQVPDTVRAWGTLAAWHRSRFAVPTVAVTGSVGKTTTKDMIASVLAVHCRVLKTQGNFNNEIGVPKTLFGMDRTTEIAVVEMGMNHPGEIDRLVRCAKPQAAVITNIGEAHIGILGSRENIFRAKTEIFHGLEEGGFAVLNGDDEYLRRLREDAGMQRRFCFAWVGESKSCDFRAENIREQGGESVHFDADTPAGRIALTVPSPGRHMIYPALTAAAIGLHFGLSTEEIARGIADYAPTSMRMEVLHCAGNITVYNDAYNANPQSMKAGLRILAASGAARRVAVLGDMFELGEEEERLHREVGAEAGTLAIDVLVAVGYASAALAEAAAAVSAAGDTVPAAAGSSGRRLQVFACADKEEAKGVLRKLVEPDTAFLVKASRGMRLEELAALLAEEARAAQQEES
ncbi:UDP-N-acetylmuramoyl-tripeptide--D-alanyl-D-alanine ligase [Lachnoclostridium sp. Marseille-P6806]|uniref:UDP-N-acetylmuramoyl-tripeptide--D-alanyl-D- alanine ligase n=1 Tax=Lachnoclostridium sp. Marseille-P6806 TaxID=2364793 RepID=UPI00102FEFB1|nr:UDP-N-acetylmuramoyl-tripeptide--D-alanyl-D-alanine ligase [Lachnoclostridium sp. Marseille-P6806]